MFPVRNTMIHRATNTERSSWRENWANVDCNMKLLN